MKQKKFQKSFKSKANLRSSSKLIETLVKAKKKKWEIISRPLEIFSLNLDGKTNSSENKNFNFQNASENFAKAWKTKQDFQEHFLVQKQSHYKRLARKAKKEIQSLLPSQNNNSNLPAPKLAFLSLWESRLDVLLWKSKIVSSLPQARQLILQGYVNLNSKPSRYPNQILNKADFVQIKASTGLSKTLYETFKKPREGLLPPFYIEAHYTSLSFILVEKPSVANLIYNFNLNLKDLPL
jgi:ribosomal protein S4